MNRTTTRRVASRVAFVAALALGFAACGGDDDDTDDTTATTTEAAPTESDATTPTTDGDDGETYDADAYIDAVVEEIGLDETETTSCVGEAVVDAIGVERIEASGVSPEDFVAASTMEEVGLAIDEANADSMRADLEGCGDLVEMFVSSEDLTEVQRDCGREHLTNDVVADVFVAQFVGLTPSAESTAATEALQECAASE